MSSERVRQLVRAAAAAGDGRAQVGQLCTMLVNTLPVTGAGLTVVGGPGRHSRIAATDDVSGHIEDLQVLLGQGPCIDAMASGAPVLVPDMAEPAVGARWPAFTPAAAAVGVRASFALPLLVNELRLGALDLYRDDVGPLETRDVEEAQAYAQAAIEVLLELQHGQPPGLLPEGVLPSWSTSSVVHQATGMVMVQLDSDINAAFAALRARAYQEDRTLQDLARDVLERRVRFDRTEA
jgi:hypothetical protein